VSPVVIATEWNDEKVRRLFEAAARARKNAASVIAAADAMQAEAHATPRVRQEFKRDSDGPADHPELSQM
jgi:hypothetical protein